MTIRPEYLLSDLLDFAELICADEHYPDYNIYHIEFPKKEIGVSISAKKAPRELGGKWTVRTFSTYNV